MLAEVACLQQTALISPSRDHRQSIFTEFDQISCLNKLCRQRELEKLSSCDLLRLFHLPHLSGPSLLRVWFCMPVSTERLCNTTPNMATSQ